MKTCSVCKVEKPLEDFRKRSDTGNLRSDCRACRSEYQKLYQSRRYREDDEFRQRMLSLNRKNKVVAMYGITTEESDSMFVEQGMACRLCKSVIDRADAVIDHDHTTGHVRGLLCRHCNWGLGHFFDSVERLEMAIRYLREVDTRYGGSGVPRLEITAEL